MLKELIDIIVSKSLKVEDEPAFKLASGMKSNVYIDCRKTTFNARGKQIIGSLIFDRISNLNVNAIGRLMLGAVPVADAVSQISADRGKPVNAFTVRFVEKRYASMLKIKPSILISL